jgi:hypothetical protein
VSHGIFPIIVTIVAGVQNIKPILLTSAQSMGASRWQIFRWVIFPHMIPSFFAGMRLGMTGVLLGVLLAELYVSTAGIGYFTTLFTQSFNPTKLLGLISVLAAMAIVLNEIVRRADNYSAAGESLGPRCAGTNGGELSNKPAMRHRDLTDGPKLTRDARSPLLQARAGAERNFASDRYKWSAVPQRFQVDGRADRRAGTSPILS